MPPKFRQLNGGTRRGDNGDSDEEELSIANANRFAEIARRTELDTQMGFAPFLTGPTRFGWMLNMQSTFVLDSEWPSGRSAVDYYFMAEDGSCFKATLTYSPYFFVKCKSGTENEVEEYLRRRFENTIESTLKVQKEDLDLPNHLSGVQRTYLQLSFRNTVDLMSVRRVLLPVAIRNGEGYREGVVASPEDLGPPDDKGKRGEHHDTLSHIVGLREYDIPYHLRVAIDLDIRVGLWYTISVQGPNTNITRLTSKDVRPDPVVLAFDIETSKMPLKFPDATQDHIMMISYMINGRGFLIVNRDIVSQDISDFEYTPKADFPGIFTVSNVANEEALLNHFFVHIQLVRPQIFVTYNGDFFDWPFVETRANSYGINMTSIIGIGKNSQGEYGGTFSVHMDCFCWVKRDSYLPAGSHGLKAVCSIKLGYDPLELDPELMTPLATSDPNTLANYSVSDAVATYYLYMKYIHPFIFSLCNIIPLTPDEVLRKGTGTLCETLLMAQAYHANVIMPNRHEEAREKFYKGHLLDSETYIGGHVEALEAGVYRSDFKYKFKIDSGTINQLIKDLDRALKFFLEHESHTPLLEVKNYEAVHEEIKRMLSALAATPIIHDYPLIYHLDVGSMYPNIILTNRLQPSAIVSEAECAVCDFNRPGKQCQREMKWSWRGEYFSAKQNEYKMIRKQLESERFPSKHLPNTTVSFYELSQVEQTALLKKRLADYSQKIYKRTKQNEIVEKTSIVCQRENAFYIDTVRSFRDRRYDYKNLQKVWKKKLDEAQLVKDVPQIEEASKLLVLYDSLQLAHKCILNSFYGYVMRKAARWFSMEMGGIVCETGAAIITLARQLVEQFGRPLELDTDGIWCMLPSGFPQNFSFELNNGKKVSFAYPCVMLNHSLFDKFTNHQYQTITNPSTHEYRISSENSIFFEIDGPYKAMVLPSSKDEGRQLKKRYAVFNNDGSLAELKGFEIKRRGELKLIKIFQSQIFKQFLGGTNLTECYGEVASVANYWLDILHSRGTTLEDFELIELISENRSMSKSLDEYGGQKSTSISTARRLAEFLGDQMVKDAGLACKFIISSKPAGQPVANRAIPVAIFSAADEIRRHYLGKWLKDNSLSMADIRDIIDWGYYLERLGSMIQKLIVIPAAMQQVSNPVPRVIPPEWLKRGAAYQPARLEQRKLTEIFAAMRNNKDNSRESLQDSSKESTERAKPMTDMEDLVKKQPASTFKRPGPIYLGTRTNEKLALPKVDPDKNYGEWVASRKQYWRQLVNDLDRTDPSRSKRPNTIGALLGQDKASLAQTPWQIITLEAMDDALGEFRLWVLVGSTLRTIRLNCLRRIYVNLKSSPEEDFPGTKVYFRLPNGRTSQYLYELVMSERAFREEFVPNSAALLDPTLQGLWEANIPLEFQLLTRLGAIVSISKEERTRLGKELERVNRIFSPEELTFRSTSEITYLNRQDVKYVFYGRLEADNRTVLMLAFSSSPVVRMFIVDDGMRRQLTALKALFSQIIRGMDNFKELESIGPFSITESTVQFEVDYFADYEAASRSLQRAMNTYLDSRPPPTIVLALSKHNPSKAMPAFMQLPVIMLTPFLGTFVFPPLDWQRSAARRLLEYYGQMNGWLERRLALCRYSHLPLGNLPEVEALNFVADVFLARMYRQQGYLLSWNGSDNISTIGKDSRGSTIEEDAELLHLHSVVEPTSSPGLYQHVTVDLEVTALAINAILEYHHIAPEHETLPPVIVLIRTLLTNWLKETLAGSNLYATNLVEGIFGWIRCGRSRLIPTSVLKRLTLMMDRAQARLYEHVRHLGCTVVYGNHHRLLLATAKDHKVNASAFINYLLTDLKVTDGLAWITIRPIAFWQTLLWMDASNFAGILCSSQEEEEEDFGGNADKSPAMPIIIPKVTLRLNLSDYLPPILKQPFAVMIAEYLAQRRTVIKVKNENQMPPVNLDDRLAGERSLTRTNNEAQSNYNYGDDDGDDGGGDKDWDSLELISPTFRTKFLSLVRKIQGIMSGEPLSREDAENKSFPTPVGSHVELTTNAPLVFVKYLGAFLKLDRAAASAVFKLIKQAYSLLGIREFSDETTFVNPCKSFLLRNIVCSRCNACRDIDFCRDDDVLMVMMNQTFNTTQRFISCPSCSTAYDMESLEDEMISKLQVDFIQYQSQDLVCKKCKNVKADLMTMFCSCSGTTFRLFHPSEVVFDNVRVVSRIAHQLQMSSLQLFIKVNFGEFSLSN